MEEHSCWAPFILKPYKINNYTHLIALLKTKQLKYKEYTHGVISTAFSKVLGPVKESLNLDSILEGFLHEKLKEKSDEFEFQLSEDLKKAVNSKIKELMLRNDQQACSSNIGELKEIENLFFLRPSQTTFKDDLLFDMYLFINKKMEPLAFLQNSYFRYVMKYSSKNIQGDLSVDSKQDAVDGETLKNVVREFAKTRFSSEEYKIEAYESRHLWAEVFVLFRIGRYDLILELLTKFEMFFEFLSQRFKTVFTAFLDGKRANIVLNLKHEDKFKKFLFELVDERARSDGLVLNTAEDYIWFKLITKKSLKNDIENFESSKLKFMIALFAGKQKTAIEILLKSHFGVIPKFFLLRELCLEQIPGMYDEDRTNNVFESSNIVNRPQMRMKRVVDDTSSTVSLASTSELSHPSINPIFLNFLFNIVIRLSTNECKVKLIEMLRNHAEYYEIVSDYIIKFGLFDLLGKPSERNNAVEFSLDYKMSAKVLQRLREMGDRSKIIQLHDLIDDVTMVQILKEAMEEAILVDGIIDQKIVDKYLKKKISRDSEDLENMYKFYKFFKEPSLPALRQTVLFDQNFDLRPYKFIIEKIYAKAIEIVKVENDKLMAKQLFKLCGMLSLNEDCTARTIRDLMHLI